MPYWYSAVRMPGSPVSQCCCNPAGIATRLCGQAQGECAQAVAVAPDEGKAVAARFLVDEVCPGQAQGAPAGGAVVAEGEAACVKAQGFGADEVAAFAQRGVAAVCQQQRAEGKVAAVEGFVAGDAPEQQGEDGGGGQGEQGGDTAAGKGEGHRGFPLVS